MIKKWIIKCIDWIYNLLGDTSKNTYTGYFNTLINILQCCPDMCGFVFSCIILYQWGTLQFYKHILVNLTIYTMCHTPINQSSSVRVLKLEQILVHSAVNKCWTGSLSSANSKSLMHPNNITNGSVGKSVISVSYLLSKDLLNISIMYFIPSAWTTCCSVNTIKM